MTGVRQPTQEEVGALDKQLKAMGDWQVTEDAINKNDRRWRIRNVQPSAWSDDVTERKQFGGYTPRSIKKIAYRILTNRQRQCFLWYFYNPGTTYATIANELGISKVVVKEHIDKAQLRIISDPECGLIEVMIEAFGERCLSLACYK